MFGRSEEIWGLFEDVLMMTIRSIHTMSEGGVDGNGGKVLPVQGTTSWLPKYFTRVLQEVYLTERNVAILLKDVKNFDLAAVWVLEQSIDWDVCSTETLARLRAGRAKAKKFTSLLGDLGGEGGWVALAGREHRAHCDIGVHGDGSWPYR